MEYKSYDIKSKRDYVEITKNGSFLMTADNIEEARKEIDSMEELSSLELRELVSA